MPGVAAILPIIAAVIGGVGTVTGLVESSDASNAAKQQNALEQTQLTQEQKAQQQAQQQQNAKVASAQAPNVLSATSGLAVPDYLLSVLTNTAGASPEIQGVLNNAFGSGNNTQFQPAGVGGGSGAGASPANLTDLGTSVLYG